MRLICLAGIDGSGKSTQAFRLVQALGSQGIKARQTGVWDLLEYSELRAAEAMGGAESIRTYLSRLESLSRCLFIFHALFESFARARSRDCEVLILVGYWYKYAAVEAGLGTPPELLEALSQQFPAPERILWMDLPPEEAARRKVEFTRYECGGQEPGPETFRVFQESCRQRLERYFRSEVLVRIEATGGEDQVLARLLREVLKESGDS